MAELSSAATNQAAVVVLTRRSPDVRPDAPTLTANKTAAQAHENNNGTTDGDGPRENGLSQGRVINKKMTMVVGMRFEAGASQVLGMPLSLCYVLNSYLSNRDGDYRLILFKLGPLQT